MYRWTKSDDYCNLCSQEISNTNKHFRNKKHIKRSSYGNWKDFDDKVKESSFKFIKEVSI